MNNNKNETDVFFFLPSEDRPHEFFPTALFHNYATDPFDFGLYVENEYLAQKRMNESIMDTPFSINGVDTFEGT